MRRLAHLGRSGEGRLRARCRRTEVDARVVQHVFGLRDRAVNANLRAEAITRRGAPLRVCRRVDSRDEPGAGHETCVAAREEPDAYTRYAFGRGIVYLDDEGLRQCGAWLRALLISRNDDDGAAGPGCCDE